MSKNVHYIATLCEQIVRQGSQPSVALIRSKSDRSLSIPEVINVLKSWKQDPTQFANEPPSSEIKPQTESQTLEQRVKVLEEQVAMLLKRLEE